MKTKWSGFFKSVEPTILAEWQAGVSNRWNIRLMADSFMAGSGAPKTPFTDPLCSMKTLDMVSFLIHAFYEDFIALVDHGLGHEEEILKHRLPHYTPHGVHLTLAYLVEIFTAGERTISKIILDENSEKQKLTPAQMDEALNIVNKTIHVLIRHYVFVFCKDCMGPVEMAHARIDALKKKQTAPSDS